MYIGISNGHCLGTIILFLLKSRDLLCACAVDIWLYLQYYWADLAQTCSLRPLVMSRILSLRLIHAMHALTSIILLLSVLHNKLKARGFLGQVGDNTAMFTEYNYVTERDKSYCLWPRQSPALNCKFFKSEYTKRINVQLKFACHWLTSFAKNVKNRSICVRKTKSV